MIDCGSLLALAGSPTQWLAVIGMAIAIFAPRWLPAIARMLGHALKLSLGSKRVRVDGAEVRRPPGQQPTLRQGADRPLSEPSRAPAGSRRTPWAGLVVAAVTLAVLLWAVLHAR